MLMEDQDDRYDSAGQNLHEYSALDKTIDPDVTVPEDLGKTDFPANKLSLTSKLNELVKILPTEAGISRENKSTGRVFRKPNSKELSRPDSPGTIFPDAPALDQAPTKTDATAPVSMDEDEGEEEANKKGGD